MNTTKNIILLLLIFPLLMGAKMENNSREKYINKFKDVAISEMERTGIPASIKLAQGILESGAGESYLATKGNNHFGIKCNNGWSGKSIKLKDDDYVNGKLVESCFRKYDDAQQSYIDHSEFLYDPERKNRYAFLFYLDPYDYKAWAKGLKRAGYATNPEYANILIRIIETYGLDKYDRMQSLNNDDIAEIEGIERGIIQFNRTKLVIADGSENVQEIALRAGVPAPELIKYNEMLTSSDQTLEKDEKVYIKPKRRSYFGAVKYHYVKPGETMYGISQQYGVQLKRLYRRNRMNEGSEPAVGERIKLKGWKISNKSNVQLRKPGDNPQYPSNPGDLELEYNEDDNQPATTVPVRPQTDDLPSLDESPFGETPGENPLPSTPTTTATTTTDVPTGPSVPSTTPTGNDVITTPTTTTPSTPAVYHTVKKGETLYRISKMYGLSVDELKRMNGLSDNIISIDQRIRVQ